MFINYGNNGSDAMATVELLKLKLRFSGGSENSDRKEGLQTGSHDFGVRNTWAHGGSASIVGRAGGAQKAAMQLDRRYVLIQQMQ